MKKWQRWLAILFATMLVLVGIAAFSSQKAHAAVEADPSVAVSQSVDAAVPAFKVEPKSRNIGGGVIKPFYYWLPPQYCYWRSGITSMTYYCYRYGCTYFERVAWGCYDGYVRINTITRV